MELTNEIKNMYYAYQHRTGDENDYTYLQYRIGDTCMYEVDTDEYGVWCKDPMELI